MKIKAQIGMVMNLDKCIGCHTCSVTCKNTWTNRSGAEYMYFNNVETKPGIGYPKQWEDQDKYKGGWTLKKGKLGLKSGPKTNRLAGLFYNPNQPTIDDYYEPWNYDYETLTNSPQKKHQPVARPKSSLTGDFMNIEWGPNWEDDLAGGHITGLEDPNVQKMEESIKTEFDEVFMMYLPRICEHCINRRASHPARPAPCTNARKTALCSWIKTPAVHGDIASHPVLIKKSILTGKQTKRKNAHSAFRVWRRDCRPSALRRVLAESAT